MWRCTFLSAHQGVIGSDSVDRHQWVPLVNTQKTNWPLRRSLTTRDTFLKPATVAVQRYDVKSRSVTGLMMRVSRRDSTRIASAWASVHTMDAGGRESARHDNVADWLPMSADWSRGSITNIGPSTHTRIAFSSSTKIRNFNYLGLQMCVSVKYWWNIVATNVTRLHRICKTTDCVALPILFVAWHETTFPLSRRSILYTVSVSRCSPITSSSS